MNFKRILVAINHSPLTSTVFDRALHLAKQENAQVKILHCLVDLIGFDSMNPTGMFGVYPINTGYYSQPFHAEMIQRENEEAEAWLKEYCQKATALNIQAEYEHQFGEPGTTICSVAQEWKADLIILGRHDHSTITEFFIGSVSNHVIHHADCSVLVIKDAPNILVKDPKLETAQPLMNVPTTEAETA